MYVQRGILYSPRRFCYTEYNRRPFIRFSSETYSHLVKDQTEFTIQRILLISSESHFKRTLMPITVILFLFQQWPILNKQTNEYFMIFLICWRPFFDGKPHRLQLSLFNFKQLNPKFSFSSRRKHSMYQW